jgi:hypothetical protein
VTKIDRPGENSLSVFALFDLASFRVMNAGSPGIIELHIDFGEIDRFYNRGMCVTDLRMAKTLWPSRSSFFGSSHEGCKPIHRVEVCDLQNNLGISQFSAFFPKFSGFQSWVAPLSCV